MKKYIFIVLMFAVSVANASTTVINSSGQCSPLTAASASCSDVGTAFNACNVARGVGGYSVTSCSTNPVLVNTVINFNNGAVQWTVTSVTTTTPTCTTGTHLDTATNTCVADAVTTTGGNDEYVFYASLFFAAMMGFRTGFRA